MKKVNFSVKIKAPKEKVWETLWNDATYRQWTSVFHEGSHAVSDWKEGSQVLFLGPDGGGMFSKIAKLEPNQYMSFQHLGELKDGKEQPANEKMQEWAGMYENYRLTETDGQTQLDVDMDMNEDYEEFFNGVFPKALEKVKELAEA
jgi:uncharacterized protein YndB with AHSA1/START domain